jgi:hypothetical protein
LPAGLRSPLPVRVQVLREADAMLDALRDVSTFEQNRLRPGLYT